MSGDSCSQSQEGKVDWLARRCGGWGPLSHDLPALTRELGWGQGWAHPRRRGWRWKSRRKGGDRKWYTRVLEAHQERKTNFQQACLSMLPATCPPAPPSSIRKQEVYTPQFGRSSRTMRTSCTHWVLESGCADDSRPTLRGLQAPWADLGRLRNCSHIRDTEFFSASPYTISPKPTIPCLAGHALLFLPEDIV